LTNFMSGCGAGRGGVAVVPCPVARKRHCWLSTLKPRTSGDNLRLIGGGGGRRTGLLPWTTTPWAVSVSLVLFPNERLWLYAASTRQQRNHARSMPRRSNPSEGQQKMKRGVKRRKERGGNEIKKRHPPAFQDRGLKQRGAGLLNIAVPILLICVPMELRRTPRWGFCDGTAVETPMVLRWDCQLGPIA